ncbi:dTDP-4-dehydrorhamnose reductase [Peribacillus cavernae]|uniref:dTDP-4-dehydrorhamnose reductase n=1 Tax=Peribacillus cavernae TaxID=1674310 RepID=A0A3S0V8C1_9BACI|nr:dTDP-4-dehydrorhamnose reductase [Peribacillus cavernae]MDQ0221225.1 dTDP-4-dehydrorhamnose reductase [Peribacillus cavernae]RUQ26559.1 dTDP-4-dehydrorhamnose reductase [Peribacillus cavernae]
MKVLVTGYSGQLGYDVVREGKNRGHEVYGTSSQELDIIDQQSVSTYVGTLNPDVIIHCAAYTAVDKAEDDQERCYAVNVMGTKNLAQTSKAIGAKFIYISTDYIFDGQGNEPFTELNKPGPIGYYGVTKLEGEQVVQSVLDKWFIVRISWVFGINGNNFIKTMLRLSETRDELNVVGDQFGSPTYTFDLAQLLIDMIETESYGIYHATNEGFCSWAEFAEEIFEQSGRQVKVNAISTEEYPTRAVRPKNSRMSKQKLVDNGFQKLPSWQDATARYLAELTQEVK